MEGQFLPRETGGERHAVLLRCKTSRRRAQQHVLPLAATQHGRELEGAGAGELSFLGKSFAANHPLQTAQRSSRRNEVHARDCLGARRSSRRGAVSTAAEHEKGSRTARNVSQTPAAPSTRGIRVSSSDVVRR